MVPPGSKRLDSWKEIAAYLGRSVTTVQRWERYEGLPIHRQEHQSLASIYALTHELDQWRRSRTKEAAGASENFEREGLAQEALPPEEASAPSRSRRKWIAGGVAAGICAVLGASWRGGRKEPRLRRMFHSLLSEGRPTLSADASRVMYSEIDLDQTHFRVWNRNNGTNRVVASFPKILRACEPRISPDGRNYAFLTAASENRWDLRARTFDAPGERHLRRLDGVGLSWAPDSATLAYTSSPDGGGPVSVYAIHHADGPSRLVSRPPAASWGDVDVAASPDGIHLAVIRYAARGDGDVWLLSWDGRIERRLTTLHTWLNGVCFTADGKEVLFSAVGANLGRLYRVSIDGGTMREISTPGVAEPMFPRSARGTLVFQDRLRASRVYAGTVDGGGASGLRLLTPVQASGEYVTQTLDGRHTAWCQGGAVWIRTDGQTPRSLPGPGADMRDLAWSPNGKFLAVTARDGNSWRVWILSAAKGDHRRLTSEEATEGRAVWSETGNFIYWRSSRGGEIRYYRQRWPEGGAAEPVSPPATDGLPANDDRFFYYLANDQRSRIHQAEIGGAANPRELDHIPHAKPRLWQVRGRHIIFADTQSPGMQTPVYRAAIEGGKPEFLLTLPVHPDDVSDLAVAPDYKSFVLVRDEKQDDSWIMEDFE